jgi:predicted nucleic acid-binding protein
LVSTEESLLYLSVLTLGEVSRGTALLFDSKRRSHLEKWLETELTVRFAGRILPIDETVAQTWGALPGAAQLQGRALRVIDGLLAATAFTYSLKLVTGNVKDFAELELDTLNPWSATPDT